MNRIPAKIVSKKEENPSHGISHFSLLQGETQRGKEFCLFVVESREEKKDLPQEGWLLFRENSVLLFLEPPKPALPNLHQAKLLEAKQAGFWVKVVLTFDGFPIHAMVFDLSQTFLCLKRDTLLFWAVLPHEIMWEEKCTI